MGKLIVIEGVDGSGKETQSRQLLARLQFNGIPARRITFPNYTSQSSGPIKMYLAGEFGGREDVDIYAASTLYAIDRWAGFNSDWHKDYDQGTVIVADRYVGSNAICQGSRCRNPGERDTYLNWLKGFEFGLMGLPEPDMTLFLDVPPETSEKLIEHRQRKDSDAAGKDILESEKTFLSDSYRAAQKVVKDWGWVQVLCTENGELLPTNVISDKVWELVKGCI